jgi:hypothetical protein
MLDSRVHVSLFVWRSGELRPSVKSGAQCGLQGFIPTRSVRLRKRQSGLQRNRGPIRQAGGTGSNSATQLLFCSSRRRARRDLGSPIQPDHASDTRQSRHRGRLSEHTEPQKNSRYREPFGALGCTYEEQRLHCRLIDYARHRISATKVELSAWKVDARAWTSRW